MELSSQEGEIPIPINSSSTTNYGHGGGGGGHGQAAAAAGTNGHGHIINHPHIHHHDHPAPPPPPPHHNHNHSPNINGSSTMQPAPAPHGLQLQEDQDQNHSPLPLPLPLLYNNNKKVVRYRECLKNHAASMGGNATDGCGEFMPSGEEGTIEALNCSACHCHRNFHRKEVEGELLHPDYSFHRQLPAPAGTTSSMKFILGGGHGHPHPHNKNNPLGYPSTTATAGGATANIILPSRTVPPHHHMIMPFNYNIPSLPSESDEQEADHHAAARPSSNQLMKKRFRTKFTQEQKDKMLSFAEKVGWKIQKQEESLVQQFCQEIGVRRRVLKVWMHNNKHNLAKKNLTTA